MASRLNVCVVLALISLVQSVGFSQTIDENCVQFSGDATGDASGFLSGLLSRNPNSGRLNLSLTWQDEVAGLLHDGMPEDPGLGKPLNYDVDESGSFEERQDSGRFLVSGSINSTTCEVTGNWAWQQVGDDGESFSGTFQMMPTEPTIIMQPSGSTCGAFGAASIVPFLTMRKISRRGWRCRH